MGMTRNEMEGIVFRSGKELTAPCYRVEKEAGSNMKLINIVTGSEHYAYSVETINQMLTEDRWHLIPKIHELWK